MSNASAFFHALTRKEFTELVRLHRPWLRPAQAAAYLEVSIRTLEVWRANRKRGKGSKGPEFKVSENGTVRYLIDDLDAFMNAGPRSNERSVSCDDD